MLVLDGQWDLLEWFNWLEEEIGLHIGQDYSWAWYRDSWAINIYDPQIELLVLLKSDLGKIKQVNTNGSTAI